MCSDAPDTTKQQEAALMTANLSKEQLDWAKELYKESAPARAAAEKRAGEVSDLQMEASRKSIALGDATADFSKRVLQPLQEGIARDAVNFDTEGKREELAGLALGDVQQSFASAQQQGERNMTRMGVNPADGKFDASGKLATTSLALASADAKNKARMGAMTLADAKKKDAVAVLSGLQGTQATQAGLALSQGNSAVGNANAVLAPGSAAQASLGQAYNGARAGWGQAANIYGDIAGLENGASAANGAAMGGAGAAIGGIAIAI